MFWLGFHKTAWVSTCVWERTYELGEKTIKHIVFTETLPASHLINIWVEPIIQWKRLRPKRRVFGWTAVTPARSLPQGRWGCCVPQHLSALIGLEILAKPSAHVAWPDYRVTQLNERKQWGNVPRSQHHHDQKCEERTREQFIKSDLPITGTFGIILPLKKCRHSHHGRSYATVKFMTLLKGSFLFQWIIPHHLPGLGRTF